MHTLLLVEDSPEVQVMVRGALGTQFHLVIVDQISSALAEIEKHHFDLMIIDIVLPDGNGFELCAQLKNMEKTRSTPVVFLTAKAETKDKVMGFALGADDYIAKPFDPLELRARIESKMRKLTDKVLDADYLVCGPIRLSMGFQKAFISENSAFREIDLTPNEFKLLYFFMRHEAYVLSRAQLLDSVWGHALNVTDRTIDTHICTLRKKLYPLGNMIESVFGEGYRFSTHQNYSLRAQPVNSSALL
jgi:two-component system response regulator ResD